MWIFNHLPRFILPLSTILHSGNGSNPHMYDKRVLCMHLTKRAAANKLLYSALATIHALLINSARCASLCTLAYVSLIWAINRFNSTVITRNKNTV